MLTILLASPAHAFCGTYVGGSGDTLINESSQVILARSGTTTSLTLTMDYRGSATEFALLLPVPEVITADDVTAMDQEIIDWIAGFSRPRAVRYSCDDAFDTQLDGYGCGNLMGCGGAAKDGAYGTEVEGSFKAYGYEFVVLSAEESAGLQGWLTANGYAVPAGGEDILQEYIDAGSYFLAAKVSLDEVPEENVWLTPIRITYESDVFALPIRIGTISSDGPQEVVIYALTDVDTAGEVGIANYPEVTMETECMLHSDTDLDTWYGEQVQAAVAKEGAAWIREFSWSMRPTVSGTYHCDPCTVEPAAPGGSFRPFGLDARSAHLTRLRMRYTRDTAPEDLVLYTSGITDVEEQLKFIEANPNLEFLFPYCDTGWEEDPGTCPDPPLLAVAGTTGGARAGAGLLAAALLLLRRRP